MSRRYSTRVETREVSQTIQIVHYTCDGCGLVIPDGDVELSELSIYLNPDQCVHQQFRRDYCEICLLKIWTKLCKLIGADPDDLSPITDDHDW